MHLPEVQLRESAVLVPLFLKEGQPSLLFTKRPMNLRTHAGQISFPGGGRDEADESLLVTALREAHEEIGLAPHQVKVLGRLDELPTPSMFRITPYVGMIPQDFQSNTSSEVEEVFHVPLRALLDTSIQRTENRRVMNRDHRVYYFDVGPHTIWGATGHMVKQLLTLLASLSATQEL